QSYRERPNVRRLTPRRRSQEFDDWTESSEAERSPRRSAPRAVPLQAVQDPNAVRVHLVLPRSFNDAQQIADRFKQSIPVILNLQNADAELSKRLIDFASGLAVALVVQRRPAVPLRRPAARPARVAALPAAVPQPGAVADGRHHRARAARTDRRRPARPAGLQGGRLPYTPLDLGHIRVTRPPL